MPNPHLTLKTGGWPLRVIAVLGVLLLVFILIQTRAGFILERAQPITAATAAPGNPMALRGRIEELLPRAREADIGTMRSLAHRAIAAEPYNPVGLRMLGLIATAEKDEARANQLMEMSARLSQRDLMTHGWLFEHRIVRKRYDEAVVQADILLRQRASNWDLVVPLLATRLSNPGLIAPLAKMLATRPNWRTAYLESLSDKNVSLDNGYALLARLKAIGSPPTTAEATPYFLRAWNEVDLTLLHRRWLSLVDPATRAQAQGLLRDGNFTGLDAPPPFNWWMPKRDGVIADMGEGPGGDGTRALYISYPGDAHVAFADQQLLLPPGDYRLSGRATTDGPLQPQQIYWSVHCGRGTQAREIFKLPVTPQTGQPHAFTGTFTVPAGCQGPKLSLMGDSAGLTASANVWVEGVNFTRVQ